MWHWPRGQKLAFPSQCTQFIKMGSYQIMFFYLKIHSTKLVWPLGVKGFGPISTYCLITSEDFGPFTQQIGMTSRCKASLSRLKVFIIWIFFYNKSAWYIKLIELLKNWLFIHNVYIFLPILGWPLEVLY